MTAYWFKQKRFGYGAAPVTWQGWVLMLVYLAIVLGCIAMSAWRLDLAAILLVAATAVFMRWSWLKTEGGWRWRWGND